MIKKTILAPLALIAAALTSCSLGYSSSSSSADSSLENPSSASLDGSSSESSSSSSSSSTSSQTSSAGSSEEPVLPASQEYLDFFDPSTILSFAITAEYSSLASVQATYQSSTEADDDNYYPADLSIDMVTVAHGSFHYDLPQVGIRMKGNTSKRSFINPDGTLYNLIHYKVSFDEFVGNRTFLGMSKFDLKWNKNLDGTQIRQAYAYKMFEAAGVLAPQSTLAPVTMTINNASAGTLHYDLGLYEVLECVDKLFVRRHFSTAEAGGNLYKCTWGAANNEWTGSDFNVDKAITVSGTTYTRVIDGRIGIEDLTKSYHPNYDLKTNSKSPNYSDMANLIGTLNSTTNYRNSGTLAKIATMIDVENWLRLEAVAYLLGNPDDARNNYNNFYVYFTKTTNVAYFIPYDWDRCLGITKDWNPNGNGMVSVGPFDKNDAANGGFQKNPLYKFTIIDGGSTSYQQTFASLVREYATSEWFSLSHFSAMYGSYHTSYADKVVSSLGDGQYAHWSLGDDDGWNVTASNYFSGKYATAISALNSKYPV